MFSFLINSLRANRWPDRSELRKRFDLALVKKKGVLGLPYHFWQNDPKINPLASHLLWAAILLEDEEGIAAILSLIHQETTERLPAKDRFEQADQGRAVKKQISAYVEELQALADEGEIAEGLREKCLRAGKTIRELTG